MAGEKHDDTFSGAPEHVKEMYKGRQVAPPPLPVSTSKRVKFWGGLLLTWGAFFSLLVVGFGAVASSVNPLWFANFGGIFAGLSMATGLIFALGLLVWGIAALARLPALYELRRDDYQLFIQRKGNSNPFTSPFKYVGLWIRANPLASSLITIALLGSIALIVTIFQFDVLSPFINVISNALLSGLTTLFGAGTPFITPMLTNVITMTLLILSPLIISSAFYDVCKAVQATSGPKQETPTKKSELVDDPDAPQQPKESRKSKKHFSAPVSQPGSEESRESSSEESDQAQPYVYTPEQAEYAKKNPGQYLVKALHKFEPDRPDLYQITFNANDFIWVVDSHPEEAWWIGVNDTTKERGYFPTNYVEGVPGHSKTPTPSTPVTPK